jgi:DNA-binding response OmpR family regulator
MLVVDDEETIRNAVREYFESRGYFVDCATELEEAQALLVHRDYAIVLADLRLTGANGNEGLQLVVDIRERRPVTRIVLMTAYGSSAVENAAGAAGVDCVIHKPQRLAEIARIVDYLTEARP